MLSLDAAPVAMGKSLLLELPWFNGSLYAVGNFPPNRCCMSIPKDVSEIATEAALLQAYAAGQRAFSGLSLSQANLSGCDLKGADLSYAELSDADLSEANLRGADLSYATLREANLTGTDLRGAMLIGTDLRQAVITDANFHDADYDPAETHFPEGFDPVQADMKSDRT
jgi:uncharacterized protein YjbI with pentapeptide repeats